MRRAVQFYLDISDRFPKLVNGTTGFLIAGLGDYLCQRHFEYPQKLALAAVPPVDLSNVDNAQTLKAVASSQSAQQTASLTDNAKEEGFTWDAKRSLDLSVIRAFVITPFVMKWYTVLPKLSPGLSPRSIFVRILLDIAIGSPCVISLVFVSSAILKGDISRCVDTFRGQFYDTWRAGIQYWPFVHTFNFRFVPLKHQPLFAHFASVYWNAVLSYYSNKPVVKSDDAVPSEAAQPSAPLDIGKAA